MSNEDFSMASCEHCGQHIEFPSHGAGIRVACPHCGMETLLVADLPVVPATTNEITAAELQAALAGTISRSRISIFYQVGLLLVALLMPLLPLAYFAFATFTGYCVYWYAIHGRVIFSHSGGLIIKVVLYLGPLVGGAIAVFFMFKPILARPRKTAEPVELNPAQHPRLYQFIAHLSDTLRVSLPKRIYLDCELNASAGLRRGWLSFLGNDLVLTLGLPLVAGLNTRQFAALVAHELGHCTQGFAMRLGYVIHGINRWFFRVVYERDTWDQAFEEWVESVEGWWMSLIALCARSAVWVSRKVLSLLMFTGHAASCFLSRQMEFHADTRAMAVAGSAGLESLLIRLQELGALEHLAYTGLVQFWKTRHQLPDSLPDLLADIERRLPAEFHEEARQTLLNQTAGLFATHPTSCQRIQKARQRAEAGLFALEKPVRALFNDFTAISLIVSGRHYRQNLRLAVTNPMLRPVNEFFQETVAANAPIPMPARPGRDFTSPSH